MRKLQFHRRVEIVDLLSQGRAAVNILRTTGISTHTIRGVMDEVGEACLHHVGKTEVERAKIREWGWKRTNSKMHQKAIMAARGTGMSPTSIVEAADKWWEKRLEEQFEEQFSEKFRGTKATFEIISKPLPVRNKVTGDGYCQCGCGQETLRVVKDDRLRGLKRGDFNFYIHGHYQQSLVNQRRERDSSYEPQTQRAKRRDELRLKLVDEVRKNPDVTRDYIFRKYSEQGWEPEAVSRILRSSIEDSSYGLCNGDLNLPNLAPRPKAPPPYERREIPYEYETELPMLVNNRWVSSMDEDMFDDGGTLHDVLPSHDGFDWNQVYRNDERDVEWLKAFERGLPGEVGVIYRRTMNGELLTREEEIKLRAEALLVFQDFNE